MLSSGRGNAAATQVAVWFHWVKITHLLLAKSVAKILLILKAQWAYGFKWGNNNKKISNEILVGLLSSVSSVPVSLSFAKCYGLQRLGVFTQEDFQT